MLADAVFFAGRGVVVFFAGRFAATLLRDVVFRAVVFRTVFFRDVFAERRGGLTVAAARMASNPRSNEMSSTGAASRLAPRVRGAAATPKTCAAVS